MNKNEKFDLLDLSLHSFTEHRPLTNAFHPDLFCANFSTSRQLHPLLSNSAVVSLRQVFYSLPLPLFPWGFQCRACLVMLVLGLRSVCPIHDHLRLLISTSIGSCCVLVSRSSFLIFSGHLMLRIRLRHLFIKTWSLRKRCFVVFQVSEP